MELLQFLQFVFLESDLAFLHLTASGQGLYRNPFIGRRSIADLRRSVGLSHDRDVCFFVQQAAPVYLMRFLFFILYTIVCINVSESLIARSRERPDYQNPLQKTGCVKCRWHWHDVLNLCRLVLCRGLKTSVSRSHCIALLDPAQTSFWSSSISGRYC